MRRRVRWTAGLALLLLAVAGGGQVVLESRRFPPRADGGASRFALLEESRAGFQPVLGVSDDGRRVRGLPHLVPWAREVRLSGDGDRMIVLGSLTTKRPEFLSPPSPVNRPAFAVTPRHYLRLLNGETTCHVALKTIEDRETIWRGYLPPLAHAVASESGNRLHTVGTDGALAVREIPSGRVLLERRVDPDDIVAMLSAGGRWLALGPRDAPASVWEGEIVDLATGRVAHRIRERAISEVGRFEERPQRVATGGIRFDREEKLFAFADSWGPTVALTDLETGRRLVTDGFLLDATGARLAVCDPARETVRVAGPGPTLTDPIRLRGEILASRAARGRSLLALHVRESARPTLIRRLLGPRDLRHARHALLVLDTDLPGIALTCPVAPPVAVGFSPEATAIVVRDDRVRQRVWVATGNGR